MSDVALACPACKEDNNLYSLEEALIAYDIAVVKDPATGEVAWEYRGNDYRIYDEGAVYRNFIQCRSCSWEGRLEALTEPSEED